MARSCHFSFCFTVPAPLLIGSIRHELGNRSFLYDNLLSLGHLAISLLSVGGKRAWRGRGLLTMAKRRKVWMYCPPKPPKTKVPDAVKAEVSAKAQELIEKHLKPQHLKPPPKN